MVEIIVLTVTLSIILLVIFVVSRAIIKKHEIFGRPPIPLLFFILAKMLVLINLSFLFMKGLKINVFRIFEPVLYIELIALALLVIGAVG